MNQNYSLSTLKDDRVFYRYSLGPFIGLSYSSEAIAAKLLYARGLSPLAVLTWRFLLSALVFALWAYLKQPS